MIGDATAGSSATAGTEITLPSPSFTVPTGKYFMGWGATADATTLVADPFTMPAEDTTLYAIWYDKGTVYASASGTLTYGGNAYAAYTDIATAVGKLGNAGGTVVISGSFGMGNNNVPSATDTLLIASKAAAPSYTVIGADATAKLTINSNAYVNYRTSMTFQNLIFQAAASNGKYIMGKGGKTLTIGSIDPVTGLGANDVPVQTSTGAEPSQFVVYATEGWSAGGSLVINSGRYYAIAGSNAQVNSGNINITINGGTIPYKIVGGIYRISETNSTVNVNANINVAINGGTFQNTTYVTVTQGEFVTTNLGEGYKTSVIINNGLADTKNFVTTQYNYTLKSTADGFVELTTPATTSTAPTYTITANDPDDIVYINGVAQSGTVNGVYLFTPSTDFSGGNYVFDITYGPAPAAFTGSPVSKAGYVADTVDAVSKSYAIIASVQLADWIDVANVTSIGFYGYTAESDEAQVTLAVNAAVQSELTSEGKKFYAVIDEIPTALTSVALKPFVILNSTRTCAGSATAYVPDTIGASEYYGTQDELDAYFG